MSALTLPHDDSPAAIGGYRVAFAHDALVYRGGAERVVAAWLSRWPQIPLYTSAYLPDATFDSFRSNDIRTSFVQRVAWSPNAVMRRVFPLMVPAFRSFDFSDYDAVLSSAAYAAKTIRTPDDVCHLCYCYSPVRLAWRPEDYVTDETPSWKRSLLFSFARALRAWDRKVAQNVDYFATTCHNVAKRIFEAYGREAEVIHAPIDVARYRIAEPEDYYLVVSRLFNYKRVDLAIEACQKLGRRLIVVGEGPARPRIEAIVDRQWTTLAGSVSDDELLGLYARARAFIFPPEEDYGLTPLESQASGRPVIALGRGGALETIIAGETGVFFEEQDVDSLAGAILRFEKMQFDPEHIRRHASSFDVQSFCDRIEDFVARNVQSFRARQAIR